MIDILTSCNIYNIENFKKKSISFFVIGPLAQLVEQFPFKEWVVGSSPTRLTIKFPFNGRNNPFF
jgi:hypothetical protein